MGQIADLLDEYGYSTEEQFIEEFINDDCVPGICKNDGCMATYEYEPDCRTGYCEECKTNTVESGLSLIGII